MRDLLKFSLLLIALLTLSVALALQSNTEPTVDPIINDLNFNESPNPPGQLVVQAVAKLGDSYRPLTLRWKLSIYRENPGVPPELLWEQEYVNQVFTLDMNVQHTCTFSEQLQMPSGNYFVNLSLLEDKTIVDQNNQVIQQGSVEYLAGSYQTVVL